MEPSPKRLLDEGDALAELLQQANAGYARRLDPSRALSRLRSAVARPRFSVGMWLCAGASAVAVGLLVTRVWQGRAEPDLRVTAEAPYVATPKRTDPAARALPVPSPTSLEKPTKLSAPPPESRKPSSVPAATASSSEKPTAPAASEEECLAHARAGDPRRAAACFTERAAGSGLSAQVALYELSRLQRDALGEPGAALASLDQYLTRFPAGSLNGEARFSRLELLARLGRTADALRASSEFMSTRFGVERAAEVHLFRGNLFLRGAGSAAQAVAEYRAAMGAPGRVGDDAAYQLAVALEQSGARSEAREAYERYLARSGGRHRSAASTKLTELAP